jgi:hypothetical protein
MGKIRDSAGAQASGMIARGVKGIVLPDECELFL